MPINLTKITELSVEIQTLTEEMRSKERRLAAVLVELNQVVGLRARVGSGTLKEQILGLLASRPGKSLFPRQMAEELGLPARRRRALSTTLYKLQKISRIISTDEGWQLSAGTVTPTHATNGVARS